MALLSPFMHVTGLALVRASLSGLAPPAGAQRSAEDARTVDTYRITMPVLRQVLPAMYAPGAGDCDRSGGTDPSTMSIAALSRRLEQCAPVLRSLQQAGVKTRDAAEQTARHGGKVSSIPAGVIRQNALLIEQNDAEIRRITQGDRS